jgi:hypothetical protein
MRYTNEGWYKPPFGRHDEMAVTLLSCDTCGADPGARCRTASGRATSAHGRRVHPIREAWNVGYCEGEYYTERNHQRLQEREAARLAAAPQVKVTDDGVKVVRAS